jgi:hypothetical protein
MIAFVSPSISVENNLSHKHLAPADITILITISAIFSAVKFIPLPPIIREEISAKRKKREEILFT